MNKRIWIVTLGIAACSGLDPSSEPEMFYTDEQIECLCERRVQKQLDCGGTDVFVEYSQPWEVVRLPRSVCLDDWYIEDSSVTDDGCTVNYYSNGDCLTPNQDQDND